VTLVDKINSIKESKQASSKPNLVSSRSNLHTPIKELKEALLSRLTEESSNQSEISTKEQTDDMNILKLRMKALELKSESLTSKYDVFF